MMGCMDDLQERGDVPDWTIGWRLQRALAHADISVQEMADELGVSRSAISRWINDRGTPPRIGYVKLWSQLTGVDLEWLLGRTLVTVGAGSTFRPTLTLRSQGALAA